MGYYTYYTLDVLDKNKNNILYSELDIELARKMAEIDDGYFIVPIDLSDGLSYQIAADSMKWYDYKKDMVKLSKYFPDYLFLIHGEGEDPTDLWDHYFLNGQDQYCPAEICYPPCNWYKINLIFS